MISGGSGGGVTSPSSAPPRSRIKRNLAMAHDCARKVKKT